MTVSASKTGFTSPSDVTRALTVDLAAPTAPSYSAPASLKVGAALSALSPSGGSGIDSYAATGLPAGLSISSSTGVISGTPTTANAGTAAVTVTVSDDAGNRATVAITFPAVAKGDQTLSGFEYSPAAVTFGGAAPTLTAPTGALTSLSYSASPSSVCTVNSSTGALTLVGVGSCEITVTAASNSNYNQATATFTVTVTAVVDPPVNPPVNPPIDPDDTGMTVIPDDDTEESEIIILPGETFEVEVTITNNGEASTKTVSIQTDPAVPQGIFFDMPPLATTDIASIEIESVSADAMLPTPPEGNVLALETIVDITLFDDDGEELSQLSEPFTVCLPESAISTDLDVTTLKMYHLRAGEDQWTALETFYKPGFVCGKTSQFSLFAVFYQSPEPVSVPPDAPRQLAGRGSNERVALSWAAPVDTGSSALRRYTLYRGEGDACDNLGALALEVPADSTYAEDENVTPGVRYCYRLTASNDGGEGEQSADAVVTAVTVGAPTGLTVTDSSPDSISLAWRPPATDGGGGPLDGYNVYRCAGEDCVPDEASWLAWITGVAAYTDDGSGARPLTVDTPYRYTVAASRAGGESAWTNEVTATTETLTAPGVSTGLTVQSTASKVVVSWSAPTATGSGGLNGYTLYRGDGSGCSNLSALSLTIAEDATRVDDTGVTDGSTYCYELTASSVRGGEGMRSASVTVTAVTVGKPTGLTVTAVSETSISLSWSAPADGGGGPLDGYNVYRCAGEDCVPDEASWLAWITGVAAYTDDGSGARPLTVDTPYRYTVAASRAGGVSAWSNQVMVTVSSPNSPPVADAGPDQTVNEGAQVRMDGSRSEDPDNRPNPLEYSWQQVKGQPVALSDAASATPGFITPSGLAQDVQLEFILTVTDGSLTAEDSVAITVLFDRVGARHTALEQGIAAFGRSVAAESVDVFSGRFAALESPGRNRIKLGGRQLDLAASSSLSGALTQVVEWLGLPAPIRGSGDTALTGIPSDSGVAARDMADNYLKNTSWQGLESDWDVGRPNGRSAPQSGGLGSQTISLRDLLSESDFQIALDEQDDSGLSDWTLWGRGSINRFKGRHEDGLVMEGDVFSGYLGLDFRWDRNTLLGIAVSHSQGEMDYRNDLTGEGELDTTLTSIYNYLHYSPRVGLNLWGALGYGWGDAELIDGEVRGVKTDLTMWLSALGLRNELATAGNIDLAIKADAFGTWLQTDGKETLLPGATADSSRLRLVLEGSTTWILSTDSRVTPNLELGVRWDGGDAESGLGMELGGGLSYTNTRLRLRVDARGRYLLVHEESDYEEWGASLMARSGAGPGGEGLSLSLTPTWGQATSGVDRLWGNGQARRFGGLGPVNSRNSSWRPQRLELKLGYGLGTSQGLLAPFGELSMVEEDVGRLRLGTRLVTRNGWVWRLLGERRSGRGDETDYLIGVFASYGFGSAGGQGL